MYSTIIYLCKPLRFDWQRIVLCSHWDKSCSRIFHFRLGRFPQDKHRISPGSDMFHWDIPLSNFKQKYF